MNHKKFAAFAGIPLSIATIVIFTIVFVRKGDMAETRPEDPEQVVATFYDRLVSGQWEDASACCTGGDAASEYISAFRKKRESAATAADSSALAIASGILSSANIDTDDINKEGKDRCTIDFRISLPSGNKIQEKPKKAILRMEDGRWRIDRIEDRDTRPADGEKMRHADS